MAGAVRFALFLSVVALIGLGFYSNSLGKTIDQQRATITSLTTDRDTFKDKLSVSEQQAAKDASALKDAEAKIQSLQTELEAAKKPAGRRRRS
jgi:peptidoglycan hydrolase CwlO-like protein